MYVNIYSTDCTGIQTRAMTSSNFIFVHRKKHFAVRHSSYDICIKRCLRVVRNTTWERTPVLLQSVWRTCCFRFHNVPLYRLDIVLDLSTCRSVFGGNVVMRSIAFLVKRSPLHLSYADVISSSSAR